MSTELHPDLQPDSEFYSPLYQLPDEIPENLREIHGDLITRMRNEARAVPMGVIQTLLMERIAFFYIAMKWRELSADNRLSLKEQKEYLDFFVKMTSEFNKLITSSESKSRTALLIEIQNILRSSLKEVPDLELKRKLNSIWSEEFARIDA